MNELGGYAFVRHVRQDHHGSRHRPVRRVRWRACMPMLAVTDTFRSVMLTGAWRFFRISRQRDLTDL